MPRSPSLTFVPVTLASFLPIATHRLELRYFTLADAAGLAAYRSDPSVARYQSWAAPYPLSAAQRLIEEQAHVEGPTSGQWLQIALALDGDLIGDVAVRLSDNGHIAKIGYTIAPAHQRRGFGAEAVGALVAHIFAAGVHRVEASLDARNVASARLLARVGFRHEGTAISAALDDGEWCDVAYYAILGDEHAARVSGSARPAGPA
jgi:RimJ/RimL family protein N-acetyltransferase